MKQDTEEFYQETANRIMDFVHTHLHEPLSTEQIAVELNLSQSFRIKHNQTHKFWLTLHSGQVNKGTKKKKHAGKQIIRDSA